MEHDLHKLNSLVANHCHIFVEESLGVLPIYKLSIIKKSKVIFSCMHSSSNKGKVN